MKEFSYVKGAPCADGPQITYKAFIKKVDLEELKNLFPTHEWGTGNGLRLKAEPAATFHRSQDPGFYYIQFNSEKLVFTNNKLSAKTEEPTMNENGNGNGQGNLDGIKNKFAKFDELVTIHLSITGWPGKAKLKQEDIGVDVPDDLIALGHKKLVDPKEKEKMESLASAARRFIDGNTVPFVLNSLKSCPKKKIPVIFAKLSEFAQEYMKLADEFCDKFEDIKEEWRVKHPEYWPILEGHYPTRDKLRKKFDFSYSIVELKTAEPKDGDQEEIVQAYEQAKTELQTKMDEMVGNSVIYLRKKVFDTFNDISQRLKEGKIVKKTTLQKAINIHSWFESLNVWGDSELADQLDQMKNLLDGIDMKDKNFAKSFKDDTLIKEKIMGLADQIVTTAGTLDDVEEITTNYKRFIDLN